MSEKFFFCPKCAEKSENITNIIINSGQIKFNCKHKVSLEKYVRYIQDLAEKEKLNSSNAPLIDGPIETKMRSISDLIRAFQLFLNTHFKYSDNYMNAKSITNLGKSIEEQEKLPHNIDDTIKKIKKKEKKGKIQIEKLETDYHIFLDGKIENLAVKGDYNARDGLIEPEEGIKVPALIEDKGFEMISKIVFKNLIDINLSCNGITEVKYLNDMLLPHLEFLDLSNNQITDVAPVANLKSKYLKTILLQKNKINSLKDFIDKKNKKLIEQLIMLRVDENPVASDKKQINAIKKFGKKLILIYEALELDAFNEKYDVNLSEKDTRLDLSDKKSEELLTDLFKIISFQLSIQCHNYYFIIKKKKKNYIKKF